MSSLVKDIGSISPAVADTSISIVAFRVVPEHTVRDNGVSVTVTAVQ